MATLLANTLLNFGDAGWLAGWLVGLRGGPVILFDAEACANMPLLDSQLVAQAANL